MKCILKRPFQSCNTWKRSCLKNRHHKVVSNTHGEVCIGMTYAKEEVSGADVQMKK